MAIKSLSMKFLPRRQVELKKAIAEREKSTKKKLEEKQKNRPKTVRLIVKYPMEI